MASGEQKIFVWCNFDEGMDDAILHGAMVATILGKELCLFHQLDRRHHENIEIAEARLRGSAARVSALSTNLRIKYLVKDQSIILSLDELAKLYECLVLVAHKSSVPQLLPVLEEAAFPFLFVSAKTHIDQIYRQIVVPVGYMKKCKDLALWASYLGRHYQSNIDLFVSDEGNEADRATVKRNLFSIRKLYSKFSFPFQIIESHAPTWKLQKASLAQALGYKSCMLIISASFKPTWIDSFLGLTERKVIDRSEDISVMCVNSQRDFYTFCG